MIVILAVHKILLHALNLYQAIFLLFVVDINECIMGTDVCSQRCLNTEGSFQCSCFQGFQLQGLSMCTGGC